MAGLGLMLQTLQNIFLVLFMQYVFLFLPGQLICCMKLQNKTKKSQELYLAAH